MKILKEDTLFLILMGVFLWELDPVQLYNLNDDDFNKMILILIVLAGNLYIITRPIQYYDIKELDNDWIILD
jgi:hypothetical protein